MTTRTIPLPPPLNSTSLNSASENNNLSQLQENHFRSRIENYGSNTIAMPPPQVQKTFEMQGVVVSSRYLKSDKVNIIQVQGVISHNEYTLVCPFFCRVESGDTLSCYVSEFEDARYGRRYKAVSAPFVQVGVSKDVIITGFMHALRGSGFGKFKADVLYQKFLQKCEGDESKVPAYISELSQTWLLKNDVDILAEYSDVLNDDQKKTFMTWWYKDRELRRLHNLGLFNKDIRKIKGLSLNQIYEKCIENPYALVELPIARCNAITALLRKNVTPQTIRCAEIARKFHELNEMNGWTAVPSNIALKNFPDVGNHKDMLCQDYRVAIDMRSFYMEYPYEVESTIANMIYERSILPYDESIDEPDFITKTITEEQKTVVRYALKCPISIITGPAGSGKSLMVKEIVHNLKLQDIDYEVCSFTGKAVALLRKILQDKKPSTLDKLIAKGLTGPSDFKHLIIDEATMVTSELLYRFIIKHPGDYKITLIGDKNQLPPISFGDLFGQILKSNTIPVFCLTQVHRVVDKFKVNGILINSKSIISDEPDFDPETGQEVPFSLLPTDNFQILPGGIDRVFDVVQQLYEHNVPAEKIAIVTPYNEPIVELNSTFQQIYNDGKRSVFDSKGRLWMMGDRVVCLENNYDHNIMNGETGIITDMNDLGIGVTFDDGCQRIFQLECPNDDFDEESNEFGKQYKKSKDLTVKMLSIAWAMTCHKTQGSEYPYVIVYIPQHRSNGKFLNQNMNYTIITRASLCCYLVGEIDDFVEGCKRKLPYRCDFLGERIFKLKAEYARLHPQVDTTEKTTEECELQSEEPYDDDEPDFDFSNSLPMQNYSDYL